MKINKLFITTILLSAMLSNLLFFGMENPVYASSVADASDFEFIVGKNGTLEFKDISCTEMSGTREKAHKFGSFSTWNYTAERLADGSRRATPSVDSIYGTTLKCGPYTAEPWSITKTYNTDRVRISVAIKKYDMHQQLCIYPRGVSGVVFSTDGKIYLADNDTGLEYETGKWYEVELYADRVTKRDVLYLTDVSAGVTYRREGVESAAFEPNHVASLARKVGGVDTAPQSYFEFAYFRVASVSAEDFPSSYSFEANFNDAHVKASGFNSVARSKRNGWTLQTPRHSAQKGYITLPCDMPDSGVLTLSFESYGNYKKVVSPVTYDSATETWSKLPGAEDMFVMNADASLNQTSSDISVYSWNGTEMDYVAHEAFWNGENGSEVTFVIDLDNPREDITTMPEGVSATTKYYDVNIKVKDLITEETQTSIHTIPLDVSLIKGLEFAFPGTDKQVNSGCDYASITKVSMISSLDKERTVIASRPFYGQKNIEIDSSVEIFFDLTPSDEYTYTMTDSDGEPVSVDVDTYGNKVILTPEKDLKPANTYRVQVLSDDNELFTTEFTTREVSEVYVSATSPANTSTAYSIDAVVKLMRKSDTVKLISAAYDNDTKKLLPGAVVSDKQHGEKAIFATVDPAVSDTTLCNFVVDSLANLKLISSDKPLKGVSPVITKAEFDLGSVGDSDAKFTVAGKFNGITSENTVPAGTRLLVAIVNDNIDLTTVSNDDFIAGAPYFGEVTTTDDAGSFRLSIPVDVTSGSYKLYIGYNGDTSPYTYEKKIFYFTAETLNSIMDSVNSATNNAELLEKNDNVLSGTLYDNKDALNLDFSYLANSSYATEKVGEYVISKRPAGGYSDIADLQMIIREIITLCNFSVADDDDKVNIIQNNSDILRLSGIDEYAMYNNLMRTGAKEYVACKIGNHTEIEEFTKDFKKQTILGTVKYVNSHTGVAEIFEKCSDILETAGVDISGYNSLDDTSVVDKQIAGKSFETLEELALVVNPLIEDASTPVRKPSSPSGGGGSFGGGSFKPVSKEDVAVIPDTAYGQNTKKFTDLSEYSWAEEAITSLEKSGIVSGRGNGVFDPGGNVLREEFTKMIVKMLGIKGNGETQFEDVTPGDWSYEYIDAAVTGGIVTGIGDGKFGTGNKILRQDMAVMIFRAAVNIGIMEESDADAEEFADDQDIDEYAKASVYALAQMGVLNGTGNGDFNPKGTATRAEAAKIIYELIKMRDTI